MNCNECRQISDSFLSDELLVETNLQLFRHLETCAKCRADFAARRELRRQLKGAVRSAGEFQIDPSFFNKLQTDLRETRLMRTPFRKLLFSPKVLLPVVAVLLIALVLGLVFLKKPGTGSLKSDSAFSKVLSEIASIAVGKHKDCALEKLGIWIATEDTEYPEKALYTNKILEPLRASFSDKVEMLNVHDCVYQGKQFRHIVLRDGSAIVSVFYNEDNVMNVPNDSSADVILSEGENGLQVASFYYKAQAIFIVSDLSETENLSLARTLLDAWKQA